MNPEPDPQPSVGRFLLVFTRYALPLSIALLGVLLLVLGHGSYSQLVNEHSIESATGVALLIVAIVVWMINWLYRLGVSSNQDREVEEEARRHFDRTGRWPEDE